MPMIAHRSPANDIDKINAAFTHVVMVKTKGFFTGS